MNSILLTGSSGFIGTYFINKYSFKYNIKTYSFLDNTGIENIDFSAINKVVHLSALVHQMGGATSDEYEKVNVIQTLQLANKAKKSGVRHFIFMSTVKVYGEETNYAYNENSLCKPEDDYGRSKLKAENELLKLEDSNFKISIIRTPIVYGFGVKANIKNLVNLISKVSVLPLGDIQNKRSMVYIGNLCHMLDIIIEKNINGIFLAADDHAISTTELCKLISKNINKKTIFIKVPFFEFFLKLFKSSFYKRLYGNLEIDNTITKERLNLENPYNIEKSIVFMLKGENK